MAIVQTAHYTKLCIFKPFAALVRSNFQWRSIIYLFVMLSLCLTLPLLLCCNFSPPAWVQIQVCPYKKCLLSPLAGFWCIWNFQERISTRLHTVTRHYLLLHYLPQRNLDMKWELEERLPKITGVSPVGSAVVVERPTIDYRQESGSHLFIKLDYLFIYSYLWPGHT